MRKKCSSGSSIAELLVVISCSAIILSLAAPGLHRMSGEWRLWGGVQLVVASLRWGKAHAIAANSSVLFDVDAGGRRFRCKDPESGAAFAASEREMPVGIVVASAPRSPVRFHSRGNAAPAGSYLITGPTASYRVVVNIMGRIRVQRE